MASRELKTLKLWVLPHNGYDTLKSVRSHLSGFHKKHPDVRIEPAVRTAGSIWSGLMRMLKRPDQLSDDRPDLVELPSQWTNSLAQLGLLEDLAGLGELDLRSWVEPLKPLGREIFSVPWWMEVMVLYCRADILKSVKVEPREGLRTWDGLSEACRKIARRRDGGNTVRPIANSNPRESVSLSDVAPSVWARGGDFFSKDGARSLFHRDETVEGMRDYFELLANGWMPLLGRSGLVPGNLFDGDCALQFSGRYPRRGIDPSLLKSLRAVECPASSGGQHGLLLARHLAVMRGTLFPKEAFSAVEYLAGPASAAHADAIGAFSCREGWERGVFDDHPAVGETFARAFANARMLPNLPVMASLERIFERNAERLIRAILRGAYKDNLLREELLYAKAEMDYVLTMSGGEQP